LIAEERDAIALEISLILNAIALVNARDRSDFVCYSADSNEFGFLSLITRFDFLRNRDHLPGIRSSECPEEMKGLVEGIDFNNENYGLDILKRMIVANL
jgi:hypothetical protein